MPPRSLRDACYPVLVRNTHLLPLTDKAAGVGLGDALEIAGPMSRAPVQAGGISPAGMGFSEVGSAQYCGTGRVYTGGTWEAFNHRAAIRVPSGCRAYQDVCVTSSLTRFLFQPVFS